MEDFEPGAAMSQKRTTQKLDNNAGSVSLLIRISHKVGWWLAEQKHSCRPCRPPPHSGSGSGGGGGAPPHEPWGAPDLLASSSRLWDLLPILLLLQNPSLPVAKNHHQIILRAADASDKFAWLAGLRNACDAGGGQGKAPRLSASSAQYTGGPQRSASQQSEGTPPPKVRLKGPPGGSGVVRPP